MSKPIEVRTGELAIGHNDDTLKTGSIGSCVVICLYDSFHKVGGLAHAMLPAGQDREENVLDFSPGNNSGKYVDFAVENLLSGLRRVGGLAAHIKAKLVGGASMFGTLSGGVSIGLQNVRSARNALDKLGIPIEREDTGGTAGKIVEFDLRTGVVHVYSSL